MALYMLICLPALSPGVSGYLCAGTEFVLKTSPILKGIIPAAPFSPQAEENDSVLSAPLWKNRGCFRVERLDSVCGWVTFPVDSGAAPVTRQ